MGGASAISCRPQGAGAMNGDCGEVRGLVNGRHDQRGWLCATALGRRVSGKEWKRELKHASRSQISGDASSRGGTRTDARPWRKCRRQTYAPTGPASGTSTRPITTRIAQCPPFQFVSAAVSALNGQKRCPRQRDLAPLPSSKRPSPGFHPSGCTSPETF